MRSYIKNVMHGAFLKRLNKVTDNSVSFLIMKSTYLKRFLQILRRTIVGEMTFVRNRIKERGQKTVDGAEMTSAAIERVMYSSAHITCLTYARGTILPSYPFVRHLGNWTNERSVTRRFFRSPCLGGIIFRFSV